MVSFAALIAYAFEMTGSHPFVLTGKIAEGLPPVRIPPLSVTTDNKTISFSEMVQVSRCRASSVAEAEVTPGPAPQEGVSQESGETK